MLDDVVRRAAVEDVRLVVEDERLRAGEREDVEAPAQEDAVVLERERALRARVGERGDLPASAESQ